jgi:hypothetical protein
MSLPAIPYTCMEFHMPNHGNYAQYKNVGKTLENNYMLELLLQVVD